MKHVVWKIIYDYEKEEKFLNEMSAKGWALTGYSWCRYVFEDAPKGEYIYRLELLENPIKHPESQEYIRFMEESGIEFVASYFRWVYFRRKAAEGEFDIYSDADSKINHYKRIRNLFSIVAIINFLVWIPNLYSANMADAHPTNAYVAWINLTIAVVFLIFLILPLCKKINRLEKEKQIRE